MHFRHQINDELRHLREPLKYVPEKICREVFGRFEFRSREWGIIQDNVLGTQIGKNQLLLINGEMMLHMGPKKIQARIESAVNQVADQGYRIIGLGALTAPLTLGGATLKHRKDIAVTNGNAYTAVVLHQAVEKLTATNDHLAKSVAVLGASGSVGSCLCKQIVKKGEVQELILLGRNLLKLERLKKELKAINPEVHLKTSVDIHSLHQAGLVILLAATTDFVDFSKLLKPEAVVLDGTQPRMTTKELVLKRPDLTVIDGGIVKAPGITQLKRTLGLPENHFFACFSETALLSIDNHQDHFSIGNPTLEQAEFIEKVAKKHKKYGFELAPFLSFEERLTDSYYAQ